MLYMIQFCNIQVLYTCSFIFEWHVYVHIVKMVIILHQNLVPAKPPPVVDTGVSIAFKALCRFVPLVLVRCLQH